MEGMREHKSPDRKVIGREFVIITALVSDGDNAKRAHMVAKALFPKATVNTTVVGSELPSGSGSSSSGGGVESDEHHLDTSERAFGKLTKWFTEKGFGFIEYMCPVQKRKRDIFVHIENIPFKEEIPVESRKRISLRFKVDVSFSVGDNTASASGRKKHAIDIRKPDGTQFSADEVFFNSYCETTEYIPAIHSRPARPTSPASPTSPTSLVRVPVLVIRKSDRSEKFIWASDVEEAIFLANEHNNSTESVAHVATVLEKERFPNLMEQVVTADRAIVQVDENMEDFIAENPGSNKLSDLIEVS